MEICISGGRLFENTIACDIYGRCTATNFIPNYATWTIWHSTDDKELPTFIYVQQTLHGQSEVTDMCACAADWVSIGQHLELSNRNFHSKFIKLEIYELEVAGVEKFH